jgi:hypothetical protein
LVQERRSSSLKRLCSISLGTQQRTILGRQCFIYC